jgi:hypothetical protein
MLQYFILDAECAGRARTLNTADAKLTVNSVVRETKVAYDDENEPRSVTADEVRLLISHLSICSVSYAISRNISK